MLLPALNDKPCLELLHDHVRAFIQTPMGRALAARFSSVEELIEYIRNLDQRDDLGDPDDGPRLPCEVSARARFNPEDPHCLERSILYHIVAEQIDPETLRTTASLVMDNGWHTFPVEIRDGRPQVVVLDPYSPPVNAMLATAYRARKTSPARHLPEWFDEMTRNACIEQGTEGVYELAIADLRNAIIEGEQIDDSDALAYVLDLAAQEAELWGASGRSAYHQVSKSFRNLAIKIDRNIVDRAVSKIIETGEKLAPEAIKVALISQFGPAAAIALQGVDVVIGEHENSKAKGTEDRGKPQRVHYSPRQRMRRMTLAFR